MDAEDEADQRAEELPSLSIKVQKDDEEPQDEQPLDDEVHEEGQDELMKGVGSQEKEETQEEPGYSEEAEKPELPPTRSPKKRYGNYIMSQFSAKEY